MISTPVLLLSTCVLFAAVSVAHPFTFAAAGNNMAGFPFFQPVFPGFGPNFNNGFPGFLPLPPIPQPQDIGPWTSTENGVYKIVAKAEHYEPEDLKVKIKNTTIYLRGDVMGSNSRSFSNSYGIPQKSNANEATAVLSSNGYLIVSIPLNGSGNVERTIPVTESGEEYIRE